MIKAQWQKIIKGEELQGYFIQLMDKIEQERASGLNIFPNKRDVFRAFEYTELSDIKVVILGYL